MPAQNPPQDPTAAASARTGTRPRALVAVVACVLAQAAALGAVTVFFLVELVTATPTSVVSAVTIAAMALLTGGFLGLCARGLWGGSRWARAPVMVWQLLTLFGVVPSVVGGGYWWAAVLVAVPSLVVAVGLLLPPVVAATTRGGDHPVL